jgi:ABC-type transport system involved in cytochrome c biogenesis permease subunit
MTQLAVYKWIIWVAYLITFIAYLRFFVKQQSRLRPYLWMFLGITILLHFGYLGWLSLRLHRLPVGNLFEVMTSIVLLYSLVYFGLERIIKDESIGVIILPLSLLFQFISNLFIDTSKQLAPVLLKVTFFEVHVTTMMFAYSGFTISFIASILYILLSREIHNKQLGFFFSRLPSLELLDRLSNLAVVVGVTFITAGILLGIYMANQVWGRGWPTDPKLISVFVTWVIYVAFLYFRNARGWQGIRASYISIGGFIWLLLSFVVITTFFSRLHSFT